MKTTRQIYIESRRKEIAARQREWNKNNPEKAAAHRKKSYEANKQKRLAHDKEYYQANKEKIISRQGQYYQTNKEEINAQHSESRRQDPGKYLYKHARERAAKEGIPFTIQREDIVCPQVCPLLEIPLFVGAKVLCDNSPTLDRKIPSSGYVPGNIRVISYKANRIKNNASYQEFETIYRNWFKE